MNSTDISSHDSRQSTKSNLSQPQSFPLQQPPASKADFWLQFKKLHEELGDPGTAALIDPNFIISAEQNAQNLPPDILNLPEIPSGSHFTHWDVNSHISAEFGNTDSFLYPSIDPDPSLDHVFENYNTHDFENSGIILYDMNVNSQSKDENSFQDIYFEHQQTPHISMGDSNIDQPQPIACNAPVATDLNLKIIKEATDSFGTDRNIRAVVSDVVSKIERAILEAIHLSLNNASDATRTTPTTAGPTLSSSSTSPADSSQAPSPSVSSPAWKQSRKRKRDGWTEEEKHKLSKIVAEDQFTWYEICRQFPEHTITSVKDTYKQIGGSRKRGPKLGRSRL